MPKISVIVPVYNVEKYLSRCVDSILNQSFSNFSLILVDDGSPDNCGSICDSYKELDPRVIVIHQENRGPSVARNIGIDYTFNNLTADYICFIDSDDLIEQNYLKKLYEACVTNSVDVSVCGFVRGSDFTSFKQTEDVNYDNTVVSLQDFYTAPPPRHCNLDTNTAWGKLFKKELFSDVKFPDGKHHEDIFTTYKTISTSEKVAIVHENLYFYTIRKGSLTRSDWHPYDLDHVQGHYEQVKHFKNLGFDELYRNSIGAYLWCIGEALRKIKATNNPEYDCYHKECTQLLKDECKKYLKSGDLSLAGYLRYRYYKNTALIFMLDIARKVKHILSPPKKI